MAKLGESIKEQLKNKEAEFVKMREEKEKRDKEFELASGKASEFEK